MIPGFNKNGYLPKGIHKATLKEIKQRFGSHSRKRRELFKGLRALTQLLRKHKITIEMFLLNGSFVTAKESPEDYDCILVIKNNCKFNSSELKRLQAARELFNAHLVVFSEEDVDGYRGFVGFFAHDPSLQPKGLVEVIL